MSLALSPADIEKMDPYRAAEVIEAIVEECERRESSLGLTAAEFRHLSIMYAIAEMKCRGSRRGFLSPNVETRPGGNV